MIRVVGTCPVCEHQQKITPRGAMVLHGYRRPGDGSIEGDCFGVGLPPYEVSSEGCVKYQDVLVTWIQSATDNLRRLEARPEEMTSYSKVTRKISVFQRDSEDFNDLRQYEYLLQSAIHQAQYTLHELERARKRMIKLIADWAPAPLIEIDEEGLTPQKRNERVIRKNERDTKRAEKDSKQTALRAARNERLAKKVTTLLFFFEEFERLAKNRPSKPRDDYVRDLIFEASKKKYGISYPWDLLHGPDDGYGNHPPGMWGYEILDRAGQTLVDLGVAKKEGNANRAYPIPVFGSTGNKIRVPEPNGTPEEVFADAERRLV